MVVFYLLDRLQIKRKGPYISLLEKKEKYVTINRSIVGSFENFIYLLMEKESLSYFEPEQIRIVTKIKEANTKAFELKNFLEKEGFKVFVDVSILELAKKIKNAILEQIPYIVVLGEKELENDFVSYRRSDAVTSMKKEEFLQILKKDIRLES